MPVQSKQLSLERAVREYYPVYKFLRKNAENQLLIADVAARHKVTRQYISKACKERYEREEKEKGHADNVTPAKDAATVPSSCGEYTTEELSA